MIGGILKHMTVLDLWKSIKQHTQSQAVEVRGFIENPFKSGDILTNITSNTNTKLIVLLIVTLIVMVIRKIQNIIFNNYTT